MPTTNALYGWLRRLVLLLAVLTIAQYLIGIPLYYRDLAGGCLHTGCSYSLAVQPSAADVAALGLSVPVYSGLLVAMEAANGFVFFAVGALLLWRAPHNRVALLGAVCLLAGGATYASPLEALIAQVPFFRWPITLLALVGDASLFLFFFVFPTGHFVPRAMRYVWAAFIAISLVLELVPDDMPVSDNLWVLLPAMAALLGLVLSPAIAQVYRYFRVSTPNEREQTKWVVFGVTVAMLLIAGLAVVGGLYEPEAVAAWGLVYHLVYYGGGMLIPLALFGAILLSRLWSIDLLIRRTLIYGALTAALAVLYLVTVVVLQVVVTVLTGETRSTLVTVLSTLAIAALFSPLRAWLQRAVDRRFYRRRYSAAQTLASFAATARDDVELAGLVSRLVAVVQETMQPEHVSLWLRPAGDEQSHTVLLSNDW